MSTTSSPKNHEWNDEFCSCGSDCCTCQVCGNRVCGSLATWLDKVPGKSFAGNVCYICILPYGKFIPNAGASQPSEQALPEAAELADSCVEAAERIAGLVNRNKDSKRLAAILAIAKSVLSRAAELVENES